jgi:hypothetical protein
MREAREADEQVDPGPSWSAQDRRAEPRLEAVEYRMWLGWWAGTEFLTIATRLVDISRGGAALVTPEPPPVGEPVWLCLKGPRWSGSTQATVLGHSLLDPALGQHRVRLTFLKECPEGLYESALCALETA